jgi:hypothetical protein
MDADDVQVPDPATQALIDAAVAATVAAAAVAARSITAKLEEGTFFSPISRVWKKTPIKECKGAFDHICRDKVEVYEDIVAVVMAVRNTISDQNAVESALQEDNSHPSSKNGGNGKSQGSKLRRRRAYKSQSSVTNDGESSSSSITGNESEVSNYSPGGSQVSNASASNALYPDFTGAFPSSKAHLVPQSSCRHSHGVACQAVCGVKFDEEVLLKKLADCMVESDTNFLRMRAVHGEMYDTKACWILVPICSLESIKEWKRGEGYPIMAIAGGFTGIGTEVTDEIAYRQLCPKPYHGSDEQAESIKFKRSKCEVADLELASARLKDMVLALAETLVGREKKISPITLTTEKKKRELLEESIENIEKRGVMVPELIREDLASVEVMKFFIDQKATDLVPDPMLLLIKAAINWSSRCDQKLLPACGSVHGEGEGEEEEFFVPSTPIPSVIKFKPNPVTPETDVDTSE